jgi:hypothetical protein
MFVARITQLLAVVAVAAATGFAVDMLTASNTVPATAAGSGATAISGYTITNVSYNLNATTPTDIDSVTFTINPTAVATTKIQLAAAGQWYDCTDDNAGSVTCNTTAPVQATVSGATQLTVLAAE